MVLIYLMGESRHNPHSNHSIVTTGKHEVFPHHMACTDTGLKTSDRPAVLTLKPLVRKKKRRRRRISLGLDGDEQCGCKHRLDGARSWDYSGHRTVEHSSSVQRMNVIHSSATGGQQNLEGRKQQMPFRPG